MENNKVTEFNSSLDALRRQGELIEQSNYYSRVSISEYDIKTLKTWYFTLRALYREIRCKLTYEEKKKVIDVFNSISKVGALTKKINTPNGTETILNRTSFNKFWSINDNIESLLREFIDKKGMGIKDKNDILSPEEW